MVRCLVNFAIISSMAISNNRANIIIEILNVEFGKSMISKVIFLKRLIKMIWRYCHHFDEGEIDGLVRAAQGTAELTARFCADGKAGDLNSYLVLTRS